MATEQNLIDQLTATGDYRVIRRLKPVERYHDDTGAEKQIGIYLDTEATGLNPDTEKIIELAMVKDNKSQLCQIFAITGTYYFMVEENFSKGFKHLEEAVKISGGTDDIVATIMANYLLGLALSWVS